MSMDFNIGTRPSAVPPSPVCGGGESSVSAPRTSRTGADAAQSLGGVGMSASGPAELLAGVGVSLSSRVPGDVSLPGDVEDVGAAVEAALTRDDALGRLMDRAFSLPPPALPKFEE